MRIVNKMVGKPSPLFSTKAQILLPVARPCTVSPSPGLLLGCRPLNDINDGWPVGSGDQPPPPSRCLENTIIWLHQLSPHCTVRTEDTRQPLLLCVEWSLVMISSKYCGYRQQQQQQQPSSKAAKQPSMPWQEWFITALPAQAGAGLVRGCSAGDKLREPASVNMGSEKAKGWKPTEIAKAYYDI